jgi:hypothetical protein
MKFYRDKFRWKYWHKIIDNKLTAIYVDKHTLSFYKNGKLHNTKNFAYYIEYNGLKEFSLNDAVFGYSKDFTKESWRRFVRMQIFK